MQSYGQKFKEAEALILNLDGVPRGKLTIACSVAFGKSQLIPALPLFLEENPDVQVSLELTDRVVDLQSEGFDATISFAEQRTIPDVMVRRLMQSRRVLCAAPAYLDRRGYPATFDALKQHNCLRIAGSEKRNAWAAPDPFTGQSFEPQGRFEGNSTDVVYRAALAGIGIARLPCYLTNRKFQSGELIHVLPEYAPPSTDIAVMFADKRNLAPKTRAFIDFLVRQFRDVPEYQMTGS